MFGIGPQYDASQSEAKADAVASENCGNEDSPSADARTAATVDAVENRIIVNKLVGGNNCES